MGHHSSHKWRQHLGEVLALLEQGGARAIRQEDTRDHVRIFFTTPQGSLRSTIVGPSGDWRAIRNNRAAIRRALRT